MPMTDFDKAFGLLCSLEGWISRDHAGLTLYGIAEKYHPDAIAEMRTLSEEAQKDYAKRFYYKRYWERFGLNKMPYPANLILFQAVVNREAIFKPLSEAKSVNWMESIDGGMHSIPDWVMMLFAQMKVYTTLRPDLRKLYMTGWVDRVLRTMEFVVKDLQKQGGVR